MAEDLELALALADLADSITLPLYRAEDLVVESKPDLTPVTEADRAVERAVRERLEEVRPRDGVVGEEYGASPGAGAIEDAGAADAADAAGRRRWIVDPIDGTKNYVRGIPVWGTLIALAVDEEPVLGVVSAPALGRRWWATRGSGAFVSDGLSEAPRRIRVSGVRELSDAQLSYSEFEEWEARGRLEALLSLARACWRMRAFGDFWGYMLLAEGAVDVCCEPEVSVWDLAAPMAIVCEAGGRFTDLTGAPRADGGDGLATNGLLHDAALAFVGR